MTGPFFIVGDRAMQRVAQAMQGCQCPLHTPAASTRMLAIAQTLGLILRHPHIAPDAVIGPLTQDRAELLAVLWSECARLGVLPAGGGRA